MSRHGQGSQPADLDQAARPIIATHFFGLPRKQACGRRVPGPGERAATSALRRQRHVQKLHGLGPRALDEFLIEIGVKHGITIDIERTVERYAALDPEAVRLVGGDDFPPVPLHLVRGAP